jgi:hypothetical protein
VRKQTVSRKDAKAQRPDENNLRIFFASRAALRLCVKGLLWPRVVSLSRWPGFRLPVRDWIASPMECHFHDENQKAEAAHKKMLKMKVAPNMFLKTKGRETTNCVEAIILMKTSRLCNLPICS